MTLLEQQRRKQGQVSQASSHVLRRFKRELMDYTPPNKRMELVHQESINQLNDLLHAHRIRLRGNQANLPALDIASFFVADVRDRPTP